MRQIPKLHIPPSLYHRQFRLLWFGLSLSIIGTRMQAAALLWHISLLNKDPLALGMMGIARMIPILIFSLIGGVVADQRNRRKVLFTTQSIQMAVAGILAWLTFTEGITTYWIYLLSALEAMSTSFDLPARQSLVPNMVPANDLPNAFSIQSIAFQAGSIIGPAIGGLVIAYLGLEYVYLFNAVSYLAMFVALAMIGEVKQVIARPPQQRGNLGAIAEGLRFIWNQPIILSSMLLDFLATFFSSANALLPLYAQQILKVGEVGYGWLSAGQSVGSAVTALVMSQVRQIRQQGKLLLGSVFLFGAATVGFGLTANFTLAMVMLMIIGASDTVSTIIRNTIRQLQTPDHIRGRMTSVNQIFFMGGPQLGEFEAGLVARYFGVPFSIISGGLACILTVGLVARFYPQLRRYSGEIYQPEPASGG